MTMKKKNWMIFGVTLFSTLFVLFGLVLIHQCMDGRQSAETFSKVEQLVQEEPPQEDAAQPVMTAYDKYAAVYAQNSDFVGWISIDGTNINYPVMQTKDEPNFYLKRNFEKKHSNYGIPYVQENCDVGLSDNTVVYGHNMKNGSMFADLCLYEDENFYKEHTTVHFDTLDGYGEYKIVAVFKTVAYSDDDFKYYRFVNAASAVEFDEFVGQCKALALYETGVDAAYGDRLLTLSTCEYSQENGRMVVVAKLVEQDGHAGD